MLKHDETASVLTGTQNFTLLSQFWLNMVRHCLLSALLVAWLGPCFLAPQNRLSRSLRRASEGFSDLKKQLLVQAVGRGRGSFVLEMGGVKLLVNPNLDGSDIEAENVHEEFDYVFLTSEEPEFFHRETIAKMKLAKVKFVAAAKAGQELTKMMVRNLAVLQNGPGGQCCLTLHFQ